MDTANKKVSNSRFVFMIMVALMALTAVYMTYVIKKVPRSVESSKIGPFPELLQNVMAFYQQPVESANTQATLDRDGVNAIMKRLVPYEGLALKRSATDFELLAASSTLLDQRDLLQVKLRHPEGAIFTLSMFPIAKRHFPKTRSFVYKDSWFFQYGKDLMDAEGLPQGAKIPALESQGVNMIATNYGNDYYLMLVGTASASDLAKWLFLSTTIFSPRK